MKDPHISVELSYEDEVFVAKVHFNLIKMSGTVKDPDPSIFCQKLSAELRSTFERVSPLPGKSSSSVSRFDPTSVALAHSLVNPIPTEFIGPIQKVISDFVAEKVEMARLFSGTDETEI
jgi:hypothetical protein